MLNRLFAAVLRARWPIVGIGLVLAVAYIWVDVPAGGEAGKALFPWTVAIFAVAGLLTWQAAVRWRPAALLRRVQPPGFDAPATPLSVLAFTALLPFVTEQVSTTADRVAKRINPWWLDILFSLLWVLVLLALVRAVWAGFGVRLRPDGVVDRRLFGSLFVPWEALADVPPVSSRHALVVLAYRDPGLVRGGGRRRNTLTAVNVDNRFLARAVQEYVSHPEHRPAIGTEAELHRLHAAVGG